VSRSCGETPQSEGRHRRAAETMLLSGVNALTSDYGLLHGVDTRRRHWQCGPCVATPKSTAMCTLRVMLQGIRRA